MKNQAEVSSEDKPKVVSHKPESNDAFQRRINHQRQSNRSEIHSSSNKSNSQINMGTVKVLSRVEPKNSINEPSTGKLTTQVPSVVQNESNNRVADRNSSMKSRKVILPFQLENPILTETSIATSSNAGKKRSVMEKPRQGGGDFNKSKDPKERSSSSRTEHQIQMNSMLAAGAVAQQGIVVTVRADFGFLKPADSPEEVYFRIKDVLSDQVVKVSEVSRLPL